MSDESLLPKIGAYVDGELDPAERDRIEALIQSSEEYKRLAETFQWLDQVAGREAVEKVSENEWLQVSKGVLQQAGNARQPLKAQPSGRVGEKDPKILWFKRTAVAAAAILTVAVCLNVLVQDPGPAEPGENASLAGQERTPSATEREEVEKPAETDDTPGFGELRDNEDGTSQTEEPASEDL